MLAVAALASGLGACSNRLSLSNVTLVPSPKTLTRKPDWGDVFRRKDRLQLRPITAPTWSARRGSAAGRPGARRRLRRFASRRGAPPVPGGSRADDRCDRGSGARAGSRRSTSAPMIPASARSFMTYLQGPGPASCFTGGRLVVDRARAGSATRARTAKKTAPKKTTGT